MAISFYFQPESLSTAQYDEVDAKLEAAGAAAPAGRTYHVAFVAGDNVRVFEVWDSPEQFEAFGATLMPILAEVGIDPGEPMGAPVHNVIVG